MTGRRRRGRTGRARRNGRGRGQGRAGAARRAVQDIATGRDQSSRARSWPAGVRRESETAEQGQREVARLSLPIRLHRFQRDWRTQPGSLLGPRTNGEPHSHVPNGTVRRRVRRAFCVCHRSIIPNSTLFTVMSSSIRGDFRRRSTRGGPTCIGRSACVCAAAAAITARHVRPTCLIELKYVGRAGPPFACRVEY